MECLRDRVVIRRIDEPQEGIVLTDAAKSKQGIVVAVGPGKWVPGHWSYSYDWIVDANGIHWPRNERRTWVDGYRDDWGVRAGDHVLFNSQWDDLSRDAERGDLHYLQTADILCVITPNFVNIAKIQPEALRIFENYKTYKQYQDSVTV